ncbi:MAG: nuclear transport factor 2 family protein [Acidimicrobiales bacterium]
MAENAAPFKRLYSQVSRGDFDSSKSLFAKSYRQHIEGMGVEYSTREQAIEGLRSLFDQLKIELHLEHAVKHGSFVVVFVTMKSRLHKRPVKAVHVYRLQERSIVEGWVFSPPLG